MNETEKHNKAEYCGDEKTLTSQKGQKKHVSKKAHTCTHTQLNCIVEHSYRPENDSEPLNRKGNNSYTHISIGSK